MIIRPIICSHCGAENDPGQAECGACGRRLSAFAALKPTISPKYLLEPRTALLVLFGTLVGSIILFKLAVTGYFMLRIHVGFIFLALFVFLPSFILIIAGVSIIKLNSRLARKNSVSVYAAAADKTVGAIVYAIAVGAIVYGIFIPIAVPFSVYAVPTNWDGVGGYALGMFVISVLPAVIAAVATYRKLQAKRSVLP